MTEPAGPLAGLRVIALEQAVAAPLCSRHLADLGADVIKVERPGDGDFARSYDSFVKGMSSHFVWLNYGKRSIVLDLKSPDGRASLLELIKTADVFLSNLGPGAVERIISNQELDRVNPRLVSCQISGYGPTGPYRKRKAFDLLVQGEAGVTVSTGLPGQPAKPGVSLADLGGGIYATTAILAALRSRDATGRGEHLHVSMFDVLTEWMSPLLLAHREAGVTIDPAGTRHASITPYGPFRAADGTIVNIAVQNDRQWLLLCGVLEMETLARDKRLLKNVGRLQYRSEVETAVARAVSVWSPAELTAALDREGVPWGFLNEIADVAEHPQLEARRRWTAVNLPGGGDAEVLASPFEMGTEAQPGGRARVPGLGEHTDEILREIVYEAELRDG